LSDGELKQPRAEAPPPHLGNDQRPVGLSVTERTPAGTPATGRYALLVPLILFPRWSR
jgi:hypothetical protein